ncbi:RNA polymerase sigma-70 factor [Natronogracilivirga saccharolytica]|uniref:RNA polymerase sigma-70 factor n=1 Tax=Natronogracilivirga saccharolytica TaxID=2812953 RepID=A0A8J7UVM1_9BACT|nr:RNA polymerase sigma-70 factor [Natronogracilivirga saccharolytica]MBP3192691.1 RNA polymerase sigma-70 factor [Natronogracilivirga saccharolytica]
MARGDSDKLFTRIRNDDAEAFRMLFDQWYASLCQHAITFVRDKQCAEDIVQDLFITLWNNRKSISITVSVRSYLFRSTRNRSLNYLRDNRRFNLDRLDLEDDMPGDETEPELEADEHDQAMRSLHGLALQAIRELPERCRLIFNMSRNTELTNKEIAQKLGLSEKTVENQITIALKKLRMNLGPHLDKILIITCSVLLHLFQFV